MAIGNADVSLGGLLIVVLGVVRNADLSIGAQVLGREGVNNSVSVRRNVLLVTLKVNFLDPCEVARTLFDLVLSLYLVSFVKGTYLVGADI